MSKEIKNKFVNRWSVDAINKLELSDYIWNVTGEFGKSFTYDLVYNTPGIGSIKGGEALTQFKIKENSEETLRNNYTNNNEYQWYSPNNENLDEMFQKIKTEIKEIIRFANEQNFAEIERLNLFGPSTKWKIAFMYAPEGSLVDIFQHSSLRQLTTEGNKKIVDIQKELIKRKLLDTHCKDLDIFGYSTVLWEQTTLNKANKDDAKLNLDQENGEYDMPTENRQPLNQILYGPPGTGKTYKTINKSLEIILESEENLEIQEILQKEKHTKEERKKLNDEFKKYKKDGQIEFITFHQSYGYEEFVEGIKAKTNEETKQIEYEVEDGIFKNLSTQAKEIKISKKSLYDFNEKINIWKISLGDSQNREEDYLFDYCIENNKILLGFGEGLDFSDCKNRDEISIKLNDNTKYSYPPTAINILKNKMKRDDIVLVSYGNKKLRAIGKITNDYEFLEDDNLKSYVQSRGVEWLLIPNEPFSCEKILKKQFSQMSIYDIKNNTKIEELKKILTEEQSDEVIKNYILIIDEINRGNISKIFGELITLIEPSKRIGEDEEIKVKLPYSGDSEEPFGVPNNLYIIGTMNTADRSIAPIDTALRRRFVFEEMAPNSSLLSNNIEGIDLKLLLEAINTRIEYLYDRDHTIGHSYLLDVKDLNDLRFAFKNKIIPLLAEYFYEDWENIDLVLNENGFITHSAVNEDYLSKIKSKINGKNIYKVSDVNSWKIENFIKIYNDKAFDKSDES